MQEITADINWLAVIAGAVIAYLLGWLWYSPKLFGQKWATGVGITLDGNTAPPAAAMVMQALGTFLLAWVVGVTAVNSALITLILIVLTLIALIMSAGLFVKKSSAALLVEAGYILVMTIIMVVCQAVL